MTNQELFEQYSTEKWVVEENLCFMLQEYWEQCNFKGYIQDSKMPINPVSFVKQFLSKETICEIEFVEKSKMKTVEDNVVEVAEYKEVHKKWSLAVTGHRPKKLFGYDLSDPRYVAMQKYFEQNVISLFQTGLYDEVEMISGMALGVDTVFANAAVSLKDQGYNVKFIAAIPFAGQELKWPTSSQNIYSEILSHADEKVIVSSGEYSAEKMQIRNEYMVDRCDRLIAVWDGSSGGTGNCVSYAYRVNKPVFIIKPSLFQ